MEAIYQIILSSTPNTNIFYSGNKKESLSNTFSKQKTFSLVFKKIKKTGKKTNFFYF